MFRDRYVTARCEKCSHDNELSLNHFSGAENVFENHVVATCSQCQTDMVVELYNSLIS